MGNKHIRDYDMKDKVVIVTGANTGIGKATATYLAKAGAHVVMACRSRERGEKAVTDITQVVPDGKLELMLLDLSNLENILSFVETFRRNHTQLHVLINNAGVVLTKNSMSRYGIEEMLAVNHLGTFFLTTNLLSILETSHGRVVSVASDAHSFSGSLSKEKLDHKHEQNKIGNEPGAVGTMKQYGFTKLCNILFTRQLNKNLREQNSSVIVFSVHPGWVETELGRDGKGSFVQKLEHMVAKTPQDGAVPSLFCACDPNLTVKESGNYYDGISSKGSLKGYAESDEDAKLLWDWTQETIERIKREGEKI